METFSGCVRRPAPRRPSSTPACAHGAAIRPRAARRRRLPALLGLAAALGAVACPGGPPTPAPGVAAWRAPTLVPVPGPARVDAAGGNLWLERVDLHLDTQLGPLPVGAAWNGATRRWTWSFETPVVAGGVLVDASGAEHPWSSLGDGDPVPGSHWLRVGAQAVATRGGLVYELGGDGRVERVRWRSSAEPHLRFVRDPATRRLERIDQCVAAGGGCGVVYRFVYDAAGRLARIEDRAGRRSAYTWDAAGRLTSARSGRDVADGLPGFRYAYGATGDLQTVTNGDGEQVHYTYDPQRRVTEVRQAGDATTGDRVDAFAYGTEVGRGPCTRHVDPVGHETIYRIDAQRRLHEVESLATGERTTRTWSGLRTTSLTTPAGLTTTWVWEDDELAMRVDPSGNVTRFGHAPAGENRERPRARPVAWVVDSLGPLETRRYDALGRLVEIENGAGEVTVLAYGADQMVAETRAPGRPPVQLGGYGAHGHPTALAAAGATVRFAWDAVGNLTSGVAPSGPGLSLGGAVTLDYDADRNLRSVELADLDYLLPTGTETLRIARRSDGRPLRIERPYGGDTELRYDALGRLVELRERASGVTDADGTPWAAWQSTRLSHDAAGRVVAVARPNGMQERVTYDALGRPTHRLTLRDGAIDGWAELRWAQGRLVEIRDLARPGVERFGYDAAGRRTRIDFAEGGAIRSRYDLRGRLVEARLLRPDLDRTLRWAWDPVGRLRALYDGPRQLFERRRSDGRLDEIVYGNGLVRRFVYDEAERWTGAETRDASGALVASTAIEYDAPVAFAATRLAIETRTWGAVAGHGRESYELGPWGDVDPAFDKRLVWWEAQDALGGGVRYDALSNALDFPLVEDGAVRSARAVLNPEHNRLLRIVDATSGALLHRYAWDAAGFATERDGVPLHWDGAGRLRAFGDDRFAWDAFGRPVERTIDGETVRLLLGGRLEADTSGAARRLELGEVAIDLPSGAVTWRHHDPRGNVSFTSDDAGRIASHHVYGPYGALAETGAPEPLGFALGRRVGALTLLGQRPLDPAAGRFLAPDPVYQLVAQHPYTLGNPVWYWDPGGADPTGTLVGFNGTMLPDVPWTAADFSIPIDQRFLGQVLKLTGFVIAMSMNPKVGAALTLIGDKLEKQAPPPPPPPIPTGSNTSLFEMQLGALGILAGPGRIKLPPKVSPCGGDACVPPNLYIDVVAVPAGCYAPMQLGSELPDLRAALIVLAPLTAFLAWRVRRESRRAGVRGS